MKTEVAERQSVESFEIGKEIEIKAPIEIAFQAVLDQLGPEGEMPGGKRFPMKFEPWPGGRWYRDLGDNNGHFWGVVQAIKRPTLIEFYGPLMMSKPAVSNIQYRLSEKDGGTLIKFQHLAFGIMEEGHRTGVVQGWNHMHETIRKRAEEKAARPKK